MRLRSFTGLGLRAAAHVGIDIDRLIRTLRSVPGFIRDARAYSKLANGTDFPLAAGGWYPILLDRASTAGSASGHYFHQDLWAARKIYQRRPASHMDIGSRIDGFVSHLLTFMPVTVLDIRPLSSDVTGLTFHQADATRLDNVADDSVDSISSLHAIEHFGLGRYGDPLDPDGWLKALSSIARVLRPAGRAYLSVPIGRQQVRFNAHRVFDPRALPRALPTLELASFCAVDDSGAFRPDCIPSDFANARFACGLYEFSKTAAVAGVDASHGELSATAR